MLICSAIDLLCYQFVVELKPLSYFTYLDSVDLQGDQCLGKFCHDLFCWCEIDHGQESVFTGM